MLGLGKLLKRDVEPLEGTNISLFNTIIPTWWAQIWPPPAKSRSGREILPHRVPWVDDGQESD